MEKRRGSFVVFGVETLATFEKEEFLLHLLATRVGQVKSTSEHIYTSQKRRIRLIF